MNQPIISRAHFQNEEAAYAYIRNRMIQSSMRGLLKRPKITLTKMLKIKFEEAMKNILSKDTQKPSQDTDN